MMDIVTCSLPLTEIVLTAICLNIDVLSKSFEGLKIFADFQCHLICYKKGLVP